VFHSPHPGQRPCHFDASWAQAEQTKTVGGRGMGRKTVGPRPDVLAPARYSCAISPGSTSSATMTAKAMT
jgi:hypothetical protein